MRKPSLLLIFFISSMQLFAQDIVRGFELQPATRKVSGSLYNSIKFIDSRMGDTAAIGVVNVGLLRNTPAKLIIQTPLSIQLTKLINSITDASAKNGEILFQLSHFHFVETYGTRYCYLAADLYAATNGGYKRLATVDTVLVIRTGDVKTVVIENASKIINDFVTDNLLNAGAAGDTYTVDAIKHMDSIEMQKLPVYQSSNYVDGLYLSYESFAKQQPDEQGIVDANRDGTIDNIKTVRNDGKKLKVQSKNLYAVVYKGAPYIATLYGYYPLQKTSNNAFLFTGDVHVSASSGDVAGGQVALGLLGAALASGGNRETYIMQINHRNGKFIHLRKIETLSQ